MEQPVDRSERRTPIVWLAFGLLAVVRLGMVAAYPWITRRMPQWAWANNDGYDAIARNWIETGVFALEGGTPTAARLPLYPALLAACRLVAGEHAVVCAMICQALLSVATGWLLYRLATALFGRRPALFALALFSLHPQVNNFVFRCATETLFSFLVMGVTLGIVRYLQSQRRAHAMGAALCLGLSLLVWQTLAPLAVFGTAFALLAVIRRHRFTRRTARRLCLAVATVLIIVAPWIARNAGRSGQFPVLQTWVGQPLFQGTYVSTHLNAFLRGRRSISELDQAALALIREQTAAALSDTAGAPRSPIAREVAADKLARRLAYRRQLRTPWLTALRSARNLLLPPVLQMTWRSTWILMLWNTPLLVLCGIGVVRCYRTYRRTLLTALPVILVFGYLWAVHAVVWPQARYVLPGLLPFSAFAGLGLSELTRAIGTTLTWPADAKKRLTAACTT